MKYWRGYLVALILSVSAWALLQFAASHMVLMDMVYPYMTRLIQTNLATWSSGADFCLWQLLVVVLAVAVWKNFFRHPLGKITLTLLLAGAVGNLIDRAVRGFVVDMFNVLFMNFAVFNVADICVVVGGFAAALYYLFLMDRLEPREEADRGEAESDR